VVIIVLLRGTPNLPVVRIGDQDAELRVVRSKLMPPEPVWGALVLDPAVLLRLREVRVPVQPVFRCCDVTGGWRGQVVAPYVARVQAAGGGGGGAAAFDIEAAYAHVRRLSLPVVSR
jgi:hypothetical protein